MAALGSAQRGDLLLVEVRGRRFYAILMGRDGASVAFQPVDPTRHTERKCTSHAVKGVWRATAATRRGLGLL